MAAALITGTGTGIGLETALLFARRGYRVFAGVRRPEASDGLQRAVAEGLSLVPIVLDVDDDDSVREAVAAAGPVDVLVNNAGIASAAAVELMPMREVRAMFETNVFGAVRTMQAVLPSMRKRRAGVVVNVGSVMGRITLPCHGYYAATKFALSALSESLAMEVKPFGVRVALIEPGVVVTPIWGKRGRLVPPVHEYGRAMRRLQRLFGSQLDGGTTPDVVADAIYDAATREDAPLRTPVGDDALVWTAARDRVTPEQWASLHTEPDEETFVARAREMFGVDTLNPPSLNARHRRANPAPE